MTRINLCGLLINTSDSVIVLPIAEVSCSQNSFSGPDCFWNKIFPACTPCHGQSHSTLQRWRTVLSKLMCLNVFHSQSKKHFQQSPFIYLSYLFYFLNHFSYWGCGLKSIPAHITEDIWPILAKRLTNEKRIIVCVRTIVAMPWSTTEI